MRPNAIFPRKIWNLHDQDEFRTNNISETYNEKLNLHITRPRPNYYKMVDILKDQEVLTELDFERSNLGTIKNRRTKEDLKDKELLILKLKYIHCEIDSIKFLTH
jgi:hypothetical protein